MRAGSHGYVMGIDLLLTARKPMRAAMSVIRNLVLILAGWLGGLHGGQAQELSALANLDTAATSIGSDGSEVEIVLSLSKSVPWRTRILADPPRVVIDFREVDFGKISTVPVETAAVKAVRAGVFRPGWSRLVLELVGPYLITLAEMATGNTMVRVIVRLAQTEPDDFAKLASESEPAEWALPNAAPVPAKLRQTGRLRVVLDPGHGGIDPGAERNGQTEAALMLGFARQLKEVLSRNAIFDVELTRNEDIFVPLEARISFARENNADVLISLHADALEEGEAVGAAIYTLSEDASQAAAATLAERHDRDDLLSGLNLAGQDDLVATILMDMARTQTAPRTERLAVSLAEAMASNDLKMHRVPLQAADFSVLKSPDIPSVLIELGFLSSARDLARLNDKAWRARMADAIRDGLLIWQQEDAALQTLQRQ